LKVIVTPEAEKDIATAQLWYESERKGLGKQFRTETGNSIERIRDNPYAYIESYGQIRRVLLNRFPLVLYYWLFEESVIVLACIHARRSPDFIKRRLNLN
jgi:plasmid stabilization system protein ParE